MSLQSELQNRILILDGAMGTMIQRYKLQEADYRGDRFAGWHTMLKGNNDLLCITKPEIIREIQQQYLDAGADIITTCTFNAQSVSMADYGMESMVREINLAAAKISCTLADEYTQKNPAKPRFVVGSVGPTGKSASMSVDVNNPAARAISFDELVEAYKEQLQALAEGGVDAYMMETAFDALNTKAAIYAAEEVMKNIGRRIPIMVSATTADSSGRTLSGQTIRAFMASVSHANLLSMGLNCSFGARDLKPHLQEISAHFAGYVSAHPNAGVPNQFGEYDETPERMAEQVKEYFDEKLINIIGGCCGTSPAHIAQYQRLVDAAKEIRKPLAESTTTELSGLELFEITSPQPLSKGEGLNNLTPDPSPKERGESSDKRSKYAYETTDGSIYAQNLENAKLMRKEPTKAEDILWQFLRNRNLEDKFRRQHPIDQFIVDFVCLDKKLIVEVDGAIHLPKEQQELDQIRTKILNTHGFEVIRFTNDEVEKDLTTVLEKIRIKLKALSKGERLNTSADSIEIEESFTINPPLSFGEGSGVRFVNIGERCNVAGSKLFLRLINEKKYDEALEIARKQVDDGAQIIDINMDDAMLDAKAEMVHFLNLLMSEPEVARVPIMVDSSKWEVIEAALKCLQGKSIVNSISLKEGEEDFLTKARKIRSYGAAVVVMAFDEKGQADSFDRKKEICTRAYKLLTEQAGFPPQDIIFDPNILAIATGIEEHNNYGVDFINAVKYIKTQLPHAKVSGGVSNLSFSFRGNNGVREAMHSVFLYYAVKAGMDMGIVNAGMLQVYEDIDPELRQLCEDVILNTRPDATERLIEKADQLKAQQSGDTKMVKQDEWRALPLDERLSHSLVKGISSYLEEDLKEALAVYLSALKIIEQPLMSGMNRVGELFGEGKMFLPQVVKTARTMKQAVAILQPIIEKENEQGNSTKAGKILIATVKGDVHDIGKNIVSVILACNNYDVVDLGVMVSCEKIIEAIAKEKPDAVGLSGLITPSLEEMCMVAAEMQKNGFSMPLMIGGATTSKIHTAVKIAPNYGAPVVYVKDASQNITVLSQLLNKATQAQFITNLNGEYETLRQKETEKHNLVSLDEARKGKLNLF